MSETESKVVFTNGCFDLLHVGHFKLLTFCRELAGPKGYVIVAIDTDSKVSKDKGEFRPFQDSETRRIAPSDPMTATRKNPATNVPTMLPTVLHA